MESIPNAHTVLWRTVVGSHMWGMNHAGSDIDLFQCYVVPTRQILRGENMGSGCHFSQDKDATPPRDLQNHEIGKWVDMLLKGNINYYWGIFSTLIEEERPGVAGENSYLYRLRTLVHAQPSKACYPSVRGLALSNLRDVEIDPRWHDERWRTKKLTIIYRTIQFGIRMLTENRPSFDPVSRDIDVFAVKEAVNQLDAANAASRFPDRPAQDPFRTYLEDIRMAQLEGRL